MFEAGYLVPGWPPELGGRNATPEEQMVYFEVITERMAPRSLNPQGLSICAASIVEYGTDDQKERFVLPTLKGEITWCVGMSEPNAGSDLASLTHQGRAARRPLRGERAEGVDLGSPRGRLLHVLRAHRPRGAEAPRHQRAHHRHAHARHHLPAPARAHRPAPRRLQRGLLHRRGGARGEPARRAQPRVGRQPGIAAPRAGHALDHERVEDGADAAGTGAPRPAPGRPRRHAG